jgi:hypothetical protein
MSFENSTVDNYILASILEVSNFSNVKLTEKIIFKNKHQYFFMPSNMINDNFNHYPLDTYGILNKSKLLMREPITGDQISYIINNTEFTSTNETSGLGSRRRGTPGGRLRRQRHAGGRHHRPKSGGDPIFHQRRSGASNNPIRRPDRA